LLLQLIGISELGDRMEYANIGRLILFMDKSFKAYLKDSLEHYSLSVTEGLILIVLYGRKTANQLYFSNTLGYDKSVISRAITTLLEKDYINKVVCKNDLRNYIIECTNKALDFRIVIDNILNVWSEKIFSNFSQIEYMHLETLLDKVQININKKMEV
jgi:DNA-binding MarR family transcriptional regulator